MQKKISALLRRFLCGVLCAGLILTEPSPVIAENGGTAVAEATPTPDPHMPYYYETASTDKLEGWPAGPSIEGQAAYLMDMNTGSVLYAKNEDLQLYPASITKIMTALLACENLDMDGKLVMSQSAAYGIEPGSSSIYADTGEEFTMEQAMMALMLESANEIALALAEETSGSVKKFVELMNQRARNIGCTGTHFNNPNGLTDGTHYTTAHDMALIARTAWQNPYFRKFSTTLSYEIPPTNIRSEALPMLNHHKMMSGLSYAYDGVLGGKTGYTEAAGNTLVTFATRNGITVVCVVMNSIGGAYADTAALLDYAYDQFSIVMIPKTIRSYPLKLLPSERFILREDEDLYAFYYMYRTYVTIPSGTDVTTLKEETEFFPAGVGPARIRHSYYFNGYLVGIRDQYEKEVLSDLLL
ncbi:MAG: D-alanyl-D-alanine carboxypeptidase [Blautia sp.]|nr:D-alanyl-D-alanine carboxypeptidase [Blautia sp.]